jgi:hypothetical protein
LYAKYNRSALSYKTGGFFALVGTFKKIITRRLSLSQIFIFARQLAIKMKMNTGVYILENTTPPPWGKYQPMSFGGKNVKRGREKGRKCKRKKEERGKKKEERGKGEISADVIWGKKCEKGKKKRGKM